MERTVQVIFAVGEDVEGTLAELAGGESKSGAFLTQLLRLLYVEQRASKEGIDVAHIIAKAQLLANKQQDYERTIRLLRARLKSITASHAELLATIQFLIEAPPRSTNPSVSRSYH
jgi:hypothetical protein